MPGKGPQTFSLVVVAADYEARRIVWKSGANIPSFLGDVERVQEVVELPDREGVLVSTLGVSRESVHRDSDA